jgi:putative lipoprotein
MLFRCDERAIHSFDSSVNEKEALTEVGSRLIQLLPRWESAPGILVALSLAGCATNPFSQENVVQGTLTYREHVALPADAIVEVKLSDTSQEDATGSFLAATTIRAEGRQVPIPFELPYDSSKIDRDRTYVVRASIRSGAETIFTTTAIHPVITKGHSKKADLVLVKVGAVEGEELGSLVGTSWLLQELQGTGVLD